MASTLTAPTPITIPFAASGSKNTIPTTSQIGVVDGAASYPDGFVPLNGTPLESGGKPPTRSDMNGILYEITNNLRYLLGGGIPKFSATMAAAVGGYPLGAIVQDDSGVNCYRNLVDGNSTNFNTTPASIGVSWELVYGPGKTVQSATTSAQGIVELATTAESAAATDTARAVTPAGLASFLASALGAATTSVSGRVELATTAETQAGTDTARAVTPAGLAGLARSSVATGGYSYQPNGDLLQWGLVEDTGATFSFPTTFYSVYGIVATVRSDSYSPPSGEVMAYPVSTSTFRIRQAAEITAGIYMFYLAFGRWRA